jgi:hypothetical protein
MKCEFAFFAGHGILIRVLWPSFLALPVNELCLLLLPNPNATSCFEQGSSAFFSCPLTVNVIGLLFLR